MSANREDDAVPHSSASGFYIPRPSIAMLVEESAKGLTPAGRARLDVLSEHRIFLDPDGRIAGVFVVTAKPKPVGETLTLELELPWGEMVELAGTVEWVVEIPRLSLRHRPGMGVRLELLEPHHRLLERVLMLREPMPVPPREPAG